MPRLNLLQFAINRQVYFYQESIVDVFELLKKLVAIWLTKINVHGITNFAAVAVPDDVSRNCY